MATYSSISIPKKVLRLAVAIVGAVAFIVLLGWWKDIPILTSFLSDHPTMKPNAAAAFVIWSAGTLCLTIGGRLNRIVSTASGLLVGLIGAITIGEYTTASWLSIGEFFSGFAAGEFPAELRMSPQAAFCFLFLGLSLPLLQGRRLMQRISEVMALTAITTTFAAILGYLYGAADLYRESPTKSMAVNTAALFLICSAAMLIANPESRLVQILKSPTVGGSVARKLLPAVILIPTAVGWLRLLGQESGLYDTNFGAAVSIFFCVVLMFALVVYFCDATCKADERRKKAEGLLAEKEERYRDLFDYSPGMICIHDLSGTLLTVNPSILRSLEISSHEIIGMNLSEFLLPEMKGELDATLRQIENEGLANGLFPIVSRSGKNLVWRYHSILVTPPDNDPYVIAHAQDVTELVEAQRRLRSLSLTDELTGLLNRRGFLTMAEQQIRLEGHSGTKRGLTLMFADMDGLKGINDLYGHEAGSEAIVELSRIMKSILRSSDLIARWGGDEFVILTIGSQDKHAILMIDRINERIYEHNFASGHPYKIGCSIGVSPVTLGAGQTFESLIADADAAMYAVKRRKQAETIPIIAQATPSLKAPNRQNAT